MTGERQRQVGHDGCVRWLPGIDTLRRYERSWLPHDLTAGIVLSTLLVPAGMAYAEASGLPPVNGLYATTVVLVVYALLGPSKILVLGPDSSLAPIIAAAVVPLAAGDEQRAVQLAAMLALMSGAICVLAGVARFGFVTDLLSLPVRHGYMNGIALTILAIQLPKLFGFSASGGTALEAGRNFVQGLADGETVDASLAIGAGCLVVIIVPRWLTPIVPGFLVAVAGAILAVVVFDPDGVSVVGVLPQGFPHPSFPRVGLSDMSQLLAGALGVALVSFTDTSVLSRTFSLRRGDHVDENQELMALGLTNAAAGFFQGFSSSASSSRTPVAEASGARTQLTGVVGAVVVLMLLLWLPGLFRNLPSSALAAIVIASAIRLVEVRSVVRLARARRSELVISVVAFAGVAVLGVLPGLGIAVGVSLLNFVRRAWMPHSVELVRVDGMKGYHDVERHPEGRQVPGLLLFRFDAPLFFANADVFLERVVDLVDENKDTVWVVVTAEPVTDVDSTAVDMLRRLHDELQRRHVTLAFAELKGHVRDVLDRFRLVDLIGENRFYRTVGEAVKAYVREEGVEWTDWEDRR
jgi:high affinity sulfate transporter 1